MSTGKQRSATRRNGKRARVEEKRAEVLEHLPANTTRSALGEEAGGARRGETESRKELEARARQLGIPGRSKMGKAELRRAVARAG
jgi:hypothetical protein